MKILEPIGEQEKEIACSRYRLVLLRSPQPGEPFKIYGLERLGGFWDLVDKFYVPGSDGTEDPGWAFEQAWPLFNARGLALEQPQLTHFLKTGIRNR